MVAGTGGQDVTQIPSWIKNNAGWWASDQIDDNSFPSLIKEIVKVDDYTVKFVLNQPEAPFIANMAMDFASIRITSYNVYYTKLLRSQKLSEISVHLGSIILDSATITKAQFDFNQTNLDSTSFLDEVKLMVDSKINKQYPHLDFFKGICA